MAHRRPIRLRFFDAFARTGHEIPPQMTVAIERIANMHLKPDTAGAAQSDAALSKDAT